MTFTISRAQPQAQLYHYHHLLHCPVNAAGADTDIDLKDLPLYPTYNCESMSHYINEQGSYKLRLYYHKLIVEFVNWIKANYARPKNTAALFYRFERSLFSERDDNNPLYPIVFGRGRVDLEIILRLLADEKIPLDVRVSACENVAQGINKCSQGVFAELQFSSMNLRYAKLGILGIVQNIRVEQARSLALRSLEQADYRGGVFEEHAVNALTNHAAKKFKCGLPLIEDQYCQNYEITRNVMTSKVIKQYETLLSIYLSPAAIFQCLVSKSLDAFVQAFHNCNTYPGRSYSLEQLPTGEIFEQIKVTTKYVQPLINGFELDFSLIIEQVPDSDPALYRISLTQLRPVIVKLILNNLYVLHNEEGRALHNVDEKSWDINQSIPPRENCVIKDRLLLDRGMRFCIERDGKKHPVKLTDLSKLDLGDFSDEELYSLTAEAQINTTELKELTFFYRKQFLSLPKERQKLIKPILLEYMGNPENTATFQRISVRIKSDQPPETEEWAYLKFAEKNKVLPAAISVAMIEYDYFKHPFLSDSDSKLFNSLDYLEQASERFLKKVFTRQRLEELVISAVDRDHAGALTALSAATDIKTIYQTRRCDTQGLFRTSLNLNLVQLCVFEGKHHCLKAVLTTFENNLEDTCCHLWPCTALHLAVIKKNHRAIESLVNAGADINAQSKKGYTPLHWAVAYRDPKSLTSLIETAESTHKELNPKIRDNKGNTAEDLAKSSPELLQVILQSLSRY